VKLIMVHARTHARTINWFINLWSARNALRWYACCYTEEGNTHGSKIPDRAFNSLLRKKRFSLYCRYLTFLSNEQLVSFCPVGNVVYFSVLIPHALGTEDFVSVILCALYVNAPRKFYWNVWRFLEIFFWFAMEFITVKLKINTARIRKF
jgi:hypothetical protein